MDSSEILEWLHVSSAFWFVAGLAGRELTSWKAARTAEISIVAGLIGLTGRFDDLMVKPGSFLVLLSGLATAWDRGWPIFGSLEGASDNWLLAALVIYLSALLLVPTVFIPRGKTFGVALERAITLGIVTPQLKAAFEDKVVAAGHAYELAGVAVIVFLMVTKPF